MSGKLHYQWLLIWQQLVITKSQHDSHIWLSDTIVNVRDADFFGCCVCPLYTADECSLVYCFSSGYINLLGTSCNDLTISNKLLISFLNLDHRTMKVNYWSRLIQTIDTSDYINWSILFGIVERNYHPLFTDNVLNRNIVFVHVGF